jgi:hypothetical protein
MFQRESAEIEESEKPTEIVREADYSADAQNKETIPRLGPTATPSANCRVPANRVERTTAAKSEEDDLRLGRAAARGVRSPVGSHGCGCSRECFPSGGGSPGKSKGLRNAPIAI